MRSIPFGMPIIGEEERRAVEKVLCNPILVHGPLAKEFEAKFSGWIGGGFGTSVSSCTAGLHLAYFYLGLGVGDEVIVPAQTHVATAHAVELTGAKPVFVDAEARTGNIDIDGIERAITKKTKALSVVHYLGMPVDMDRVNAIAKKHNLFVVEDCALAIGTYFKGVHAGLMGDIGCFSFYPVKHMTTAEGGMVTSKHEEVISKIARQKAFGVDRTVAERKEPGVYDVTMLGFNYRMNEIQAAIGIEQIDRLKGFLQKRKENFEILTQGLMDLPDVTHLESSSGHFESSHYCLSIVLGEKYQGRRSEIAKAINARGVGTSVYYPMPVPHLQYYRQKYGYSTEQFPNAARISYQSIALTVGPHVGKEDMEYQAEQVREVLKGY